jgi:hypothetical protein
MNTSHVTCSRARHLDVEGLFYRGKRNLFTERPTSKTSDSWCCVLPPGIANSPPHQRLAPRRLQLPRPMEEDNRDTSGSQIWITLRRDRRARDPSSFATCPIIAIFGSDSSHHRPPPLRTSPVVHPSGSARQPPGTGPLLLPSTF